MEFFLSTKKNEILSFASKCMELENLILSEVSQAQKAKNHMFSLIADYRPKTNAVILLDIGHTQRGEHRSHTKGRTHIGGLAKRKET
jgi:hypothetical protein